MLNDNVWLSVAGMLIAIVVVIGLAYWFTRYVVGNRLFLGMGPTGNRQMQVLDQLPVGKEQRLVVVRAGERYLLLGVTGQNISVLAELTAEEAEQWLQENGTENRPPDFKQALIDSLQKRKAR